MQARRDGKWEVNVVSVRGLLIGGMLWICGWGCNLPSQRGVAFQRQRLQGVSYSAAFDAAERALLEHFRIELRDPEAGILRGAPAETVLGAERSGLISDTLGTPRRSRRLALLRIHADGDDVEITCRVLLQQNEAAAFRVLHRGWGVEDQPTETAADREAATTMEQNTVWRTKRRDRAMERLILASIRDQLGQPDG